MKKRIFRKEQILKINSSDWISITIDEPTNAKVIDSVIFCHGLSGEKVGPQRLLTLISEKIVRQCFKRVIRFDFRGSGISSGNFSDINFQSMLEDALFVAKKNIPSTQKCVWMGISTGALIALMACAARKNNEKVIAISNGFAESINFSFTSKNKMVSIREGQFFLPKAYFLSRENLKPRKNLFPFCPSINCILGSLDSKHAKQALSLKKYGVKIIMIKGGDHLFTDPPIRKKLLTQICGLL